MAPSATLAVGMVLVVDELIFKADVSLRGGQVVFHPAVAHRADLPLPCQLEIPEVLDGHDVAAARALAEKNSPVQHRPAFRGDAAFPDGLPTGERLAVKEQLPSGGGFVGGEGVGVRALRSEKREKQSEAGGEEGGADEHGG